MIREEGGEKKLLLFPLHYVLGDVQYCIDVMTTYFMNPIYIRFRIPKTVPSVCMSQVILLPSIPTDILYSIRPTRDLRAYKATRQW